MMTARPRICLIDDDTFVRDTLALGLSDAGFDVLPAAGAAPGFDLVRQQSVDGVVTDMGMPGVSGAQLIAELREHWPRLPIVAISGAGVIDGRPIVEVAQALGADATMVKPFRTRDLAELIHRLLARAAERR